MAKHERKSLLRVSDTVFTEVTPIQRTAILEMHYEIGRLSAQVEALTKERDQAREGGSAGGSRRRPQALAGKRSKKIHAPQSLTDGSA